MRTFEYVCFEGASSRKQPLRCFAKTETLVKSDFKCVFFTVLNVSFYSYIKNVHYGLSSTVLS